MKKIIGIMTIAVLAFVIQLNADKILNNDTTLSELISLNLVDAHADPEDWEQELYDLEHSECYEECDYITVECGEINLPGRGWEPVFCTEYRCYQFCEA